MSENIAEALRGPVAKTGPGPCRDLSRVPIQVPRCTECALCKSAGAPASSDEPTEIQSLRSGFRRLPPKARIYLEGDPPDEVYTLFSGWAFRYKVLYDGSRQIYDFVLPGDMLGLPLNDFLDRMDHSVEAITDVSLCAFPARSVLRQIRLDTNAASRVASIKGGESARAYERLTSLGRRTAHERMAQLILELFTRLSLRNAVDGATCEFPLTQNLLADALGLCAVHVNRIIRQFREKNLVTVRAGTLTVHDFPRLEEICDFDQTYLTPQAMLCGTGAFRCS